MSVEARARPPVGMADAFSSDRDERGKFMTTEELFALAASHNAGLDDETERRLRLAVRDASLNTICRQVARQSMAAQALRDIRVTVEDRPRP